MKQSLDYENVHQVEAVVVATNQRQLTGEDKARLLSNMSAPNVALVSVEVMDQNDHGPMFDKNVYLAGECSTLRSHTCGVNKVCFSHL